jgi:hypothetical protein
VQPARYLQSAQSFPETEMDLPPTALPAKPGTAPAGSTATP